MKDHRNSSSPNAVNFRNNCFLEYGFGGRLTMKMNTPPPPPPPPRSINSPPRYAGPVAGAGRNRGGDINLHGTRSTQGSIESAVPSRERVSSGGHRAVYRQPDLSAHTLRTPLPLRHPGPGTSLPATHMVQVVGCHPQTCVLFVQL